MKFRLSIASRTAEVLRCQYFIAESYNKNFGIMFSEEIHNLEAKIEPYPQRYLMGTIDGELVATLALYTRDTYVERYGQITDEEIEQQLQAAGVADQYQGAVKRELTKLVVKEGWDGHGLARIIHTRAHARAFLEQDTTSPAIVMVCAKVSLLRHMYSPRGVIGSRFLAPFPRYPIHNAYRSDEDPMESRLTIPSLDVPEELRELQFPLEVEIGERPAPKGGR